MPSQTQDWLGKPYGSLVRSQHDGGWVALLRPTADLWSATLRHRTQIVYAADISLACMMMELKPGSVGAPTKGTARNTYIEANQYSVGDWYRVWVFDDLACALCGTIRPRPHL